MYNDFSLACSNPHQSTVHFSYHTSWERLILLKISVNKIDDPFTGPRFPSNDDCRAVAFYRKGRLGCSTRTLTFLDGSQPWSSHSERAGSALDQIYQAFSRWRSSNDRRGFRLLLFLRRYDSLSCLADADAAPRPERKVHKDGSSPRYRKVASSLE